VDSSGAHLAATTPITFTIAPGSTIRLQQLLAQLGYLPLSYTPPNPAPAPADMALTQPGTLAWRWPNTPPSLSSLWIQGEPNVITKSAIESFESQNGLTVDGLAGPEVWSTLLADVATSKGDAVPYTYVLVTKTLPEHLTVFVNGSVQLANIPVNTGAPGADTVDGTYAVFEHVKASDMKGTNVTGSTYNDPTVPWASYFNGGDALHGFVRAHYGFPQSNGCVEMAITNAAQVWPLTPVGTVVTVVGPPS
jgi:peptidoglycan hydrolase-like protein with peptidoglycan-binding domain